MTAAMYVGASILSISSWPIVTVCSGDVVTGADVGHEILPALLARADFVPVELTQEDSDGR